jgi:dihydroorotase
VTHTFVNGHWVYDNGQFNETEKGQPLTKTNEGAQAKSQNM